MLRLTYFHTQEKRHKELTKPIKCTKENAWLGEAYYFWEDEQDALRWGEQFKRGNYQVYEATLKENTEILDTVFNREHYESWIKLIEKICQTFIKKTGEKPTLKEINNYFLQKEVFKNLDGILFQDISKNPDNYLVKKMQYKKRIQLALYNFYKIKNFKIHYES